MSFNISSWAIKRPLPSILVSLILLTLGWISFQRLPITRMPNADIPVITVVVTQFGSGPAEIEREVTRTIEDGLAGVEGVRHISSVINDGVSLTTIEFRIEANTDRALNDVKDAVTRIRSNLPQLSQEPMIQRVEIAGLPILSYAAVGNNKTAEELSAYIETIVTREIQGVRGVGQVETVGGVEREILVSLDPDKLDAYGITTVDVSRRLRAMNADVAGGRASLGGRDHAIRTLGGARSIDDLSGTMLGLASGGEVQLKDLGTVIDTVADRRTFASLDGKPVVAFNIKRSKGASDVAVANAVKAKVDRLNADHPEIRLVLISTQVDYTLGNYDATVHTLFEGAALAVLVVLLFLRDFRATVIVAISLPLSIFPAFWVMDLLGFSLNSVSFLAVTLSTGILVDDSIVEIENISRHIRMGKTPYRAAIDAADEIGLAVIAISLTIIAIFVPASFMSGLVGQFFKQFGITVAVQVFFSLLAARLVTPMLAAYLLKQDLRPEPEPGRAEQWYTRLVTVAVRHYVLTVILGFVVLAGSIGSMMLLPTGFMPRSDTARTLISIELSPGSQASDTQAVTEAISRDLGGIKEVRSVFVDGGRSPQGSVDVRRATIVVNFSDKSARSITQRDLEQEIERRLQRVPDIRYWLVDDIGLRAVSLVVTGDDPRAVGGFANELANQMRGLPTLSNVISSATLDRPELRIIPRKDLAARLGVTASAISETISVATIGDAPQALAKFDTGGKLVPIRVQLNDAARSSLETLKDLRVPMAGGPRTIALSAVADIRPELGPANIARYDRQRQASVEADLVGNAALGDVLKTVLALPIAKNPPKGVKLSQSGDAENLNELADGFVDTMRLGLLMVYAVLALLFGSFLQPLVILLSLPLSIGGAVGALLLTGHHLTTPVFIGLLMLMGIVTKNAIMLVDFAIESMHRGVPRDVAIVDAGRKRARPIVMTTIAMAAGMIPSALAIGAGGEFRAPMAITVIGGLLFSTILSLVFVPALLMLMGEATEGVQAGVRRILRRPAPPPRPETDAEGATGSQAAAAAFAAASEPGR